MAPQEQVFGFVQVALLKLCMCGGLMVGVVVGGIVGTEVCWVVDGTVEFVADSLVLIEEVLPGESILTGASVLGSVKNVAITRTIIAMVFNLPFTNLQRKFCHLLIGANNKVIIIDVKHAKLGRLPSAIITKKQVTIQSPITLTNFIICKSFQQHYYLEIHRKISPIPKVVLWYILLYTARFGFLI